MAEPKVLNEATGQLVHGAAIADPSGGATVDAEARTATNGILDSLRDKGVIAGATSINTGHVWNNSVSQVVLGPAIPDASGGATIDAECRTAINAILTVLRNNGVIADSPDLFTRSYLEVDENDQAWASAAIADPSGGATVDTECRSTISDALAAMRSRGLIADD